MDTTVQGNHAKGSGDVVFAVCLFYFNFPVLHIVPSLLNLRIHGISTYYVLLHIIQIIHLWFCSLFSTLCINCCQT